MHTFRHLRFPSPLVLTNHGENAAFSDYHFETDNEDLAQELSAHPDIEHIEKPEPEPESEPESEPTPEAEPTPPAPRRRKKKTPE